jgi:hypothetical protein
VPTSNSEKLLVTWVDSALAKLDDWVFITTLSRIHALLGPRGDLAERLRGFHDRYCNLKLNGLPAQRAALRSVRVGEVSEGPGTGRRDPFSAKLIAQHCDTDTAIEGALEKEDFVKALAAAQYGPAYVLAWTDAPTELCPLLAIPLRFTDPLAPVDVSIKKEITAAVKRAQSRWPRVRLDTDALDFGSAHAFARGYSLALADVSFVQKPKKPKRAARD